MKKRILTLILILMPIIINTQPKNPRINKGHWMKLKNYYHNTPVLVTGGCGFIGSHLVEKLVELGARVTILDNLSSGSLENIKNVQDSVTIIQKDIADFDACLESTRDQSVVFHLAAFISVPQSIKEPDVCHRTNVDGTFNMLEAARRNGVDSFVFSSSAAVYGPHEGICSENTPIAPTSPYGFSKYIGEQYCHQYKTNFNISTAALRYFNVWGERQNPNGAYAAAVAKFTQHMKENTPITIFGDG
jgi:nucleoside-diphosphate-sugar epimerase